MPALFEHGKIVATIGATEAIPDSVMVAALRRHLTGDFGDLDEQDKKANLWSIDNGARVFSAYDHDDTRFYIVTEHDRSVTTVLLASEY